MNKELKQKIKFAAKDKSIIHLSVEGENWDIEDIEYSDWAILLREEDPRIEDQEYYFFEIEDFLKC